MTYAQKLIELFRKQRNEENAGPMEAYMRNQFEYSSESKHRKGKRCSVRSLRSMGIRLYTSSLKRSGHFGSSLSVSSSM